MSFSKTVKHAGISVIAISLAGLVGASPANAATPQINLCRAGNYATLSHVLTNAAGVTVRSDTAGTLMGDSSPVESDGFLQPGANLVSQQSGADYTAAIGSLRDAIDSVKTNILPYATHVGSDSLSTAEIIPGQLGVFPAGIYATTAAMSITADQQIALTGDANSVFVFISGEAFNIGASVQILLDGGAQAKNVYWVVGTFVGALTAGASSTLVGNYLVDGTMSVGASAHLNGRILAMNTITFGASAYLDSLPPATSCGASVMSDNKAIEFTDTTLVDGTRGQVYSDYVAARTLLNGAADSQTVTYSISPSLADLGLSMSEAGMVTGTVLSTATLGTQSFTVTATSDGYIPQTYVYSLVIKAAVAIPARTPEVFATALAVAAPRVWGAKAGDASATIGMWAPTRTGGDAIVGYQYSLDNGSSWSWVDGSSSALRQVITGLTNGVHYVAILRAVTVSGAGKSSKALGFTPRTVPSKPVNFTVTAGSKMIALAFTTPVPDGGSPITRYSYSINGGPWKSLGTKKTGVIRNLKNGTAYSVRVVAKNVVGFGEPSEAVHVTPTQ